LLNRISKPTALNYTSPLFVIAKTPIVMNLSNILLSLIPLILIIISFSFTVVTTINPDWAHQDHFDGTIARRNWTEPLYTLYRSPFIVCSPSAVYENGTAATSSTISQTGSRVNPVDDDLDQRLRNLTWTVSCARFGPIGTGKRSCETNVGTNISATDARFGDDRQCQQIHMAGSLSIASSVFIGISLLTMLVLFGLSLAASSNSTISTTLSITTVMLLLLGAASMFIAQFYGVLGLIQSAVPNGNYAADGSLPSAAGPWVQGKASVIYGSLSWLGGALAAGVVTAIFGVSRGASTARDSSSGGGGGGLWSGKGSRSEAAEY
jgi:hypothetical protein